MMMPPYTESVIPPTTGALTHKSTQACILQWRKIYNQQKTAT